MPLKHRAILTVAFGGSIMISALAWIGLSDRVANPLVASLAARVTTLAMAHPAPRPSSSAADASSMPLFTATNAISSPTVATSIRVLGLALGPRRQAALVSLDAKAPIWMKIGQSADGFELRAIGRSGATFSTPSGDRKIGLFDRQAPDPGLAENPASLSPPLQSGLPTAAASTDTPPPGYRPPPPPADAPKPKSCSPRC